ncbi:hypothetical protein PFISCL1PPCAC_19746 [Pristionchus fissidentatus]|uniref:PDZ domain-containing protein n=1 Tax=Pristionchus fissidentatus TaxID=1538716 RepID=A0AAV5WF57_9BILA|nr:hypothetical protein PFISCL1PPCAC_19746 [Pristionchus fissidentatus]
MNEQCGTIACTLSMGREEVQFDRDRLVLPKVENGRRTIVINRSSVDESLGMSLQSDVIQTEDGELKRYTYLGNVQIGGLAHKSGLRNGDILVAVNGNEVLNMCHSNLRSLLSSTLEARIVVVARENCTLIHLHYTKILLRARLKQAEEELQQITCEEEDLLARYRNRLRNSSSSLSSSSSPSRVSRKIILTNVQRMDSVASSSATKQITRL